MSGGTALWRGSARVAAKAVVALALVLLVGIGLAARSQSTAEGAADAEAAAATAAPKKLGPETRLPLPRYVSLRSGEVNVRRGPGLDHRKDWVFRRAGLPVQIVEEYGDWRRIVDRDGASGWVFHALLSGRRTAIVLTDGAVLLSDPEPEAAPVAEAEAGVVARLRRCAPLWCQIEKDGYRGWLPKTALWGADANEVFPR